MTSPHKFNVSVTKLDAAPYQAQMPPELSATALKRFFEMTLEFAADEVFWMASDARVIHANQSACIKLEYERQELIGQFLWLWDPQFSEDVWSTFWDQLKASRHIEYETKHQTKFGKVFPVLVKGHLLTIEDEDYLLAYVSDITQQKAREDELRNYERDLNSRHQVDDNSYLKKVAQRLSKLEITANIGTWEVDTLTNTLSWSEQTKRIHEVPEDYLPDVQTSIDFYKAGIDRDTIKTVFEKAVASLTPWDEELTIVTAKGNERLMRVIGNAESENGKCIRVFGVFQDITDKDNLRRELVESQRNLQNIMDRSSAVVYVKDLDGHYQFVNEKYLAIFNFSRQQVIGKTDFELLPFQAALQVTENDKRVIASEQNITLEEQIPQKDGMRTYISDKFPLFDQKGRLNALCGISTDITFQRQQEQQLRQAQKMDALGKLTGGIAHDFNNLLGIIMGHAELIGLSDTHPISVKSADMIVKACERGERLTKRLLGFSSQQPSQLEVVSVNDVILDNYEMLQRLLTVSVDFSLDLSPNLWSCELDVAGFEDALLNLIVNAQHAIENKGSLAIMTRNLVANSERSQHHQASQSEFVQVRIIDNGCGMDEATQQRVFEPFFTTKGSSGTGLGLSQVYGFTQRCNGEIKVVSTLGSGTSIELYFPRQKDAKVSFIDTAESHAVQPGRASKVLVVDDEEELTNVIGVILTANGYSVTRCLSAEQALKELDNQEFDLVLSDIVMPRMDGIEFTNLVKERYPGSQTLLISGYPDREEKQLSGDFLYKPFKAEVLLRRVSELLSSR